MSFNELTGTVLLRNFTSLMKKVLEGQIITFKYKGNLFDIVPRQNETQGQNMARRLRESNQPRDKQEEAVDNQDIYKMYKSAYAKE